MRKAGSEGRWKINIIFLILIIFTAGLYSCSSQKENMAHTTAQNFLGALQSQDMEAMRIYYPDIDNIEVFYACDTFVIENINPLAENGYLVHASNFYMNDSRDLVIKEVILFIYPDDYNAVSVNINNNTGFYITDSYGLCSWKNYPHYLFAQNTGCINDKLILTDQQAVHRLRVAKDLLFYFSKKMHNDMENSIVVTDKTLLAKDFNSAKGCATVINNSEFTLPDLKYVIVYYDINDKKIGEDNGWVTKDMFAAGDTIKFNFETNFNKKATDATFRLDFDLELILQFVMNDDIYNGSEYMAFISKKLPDI